MTTTRTTNDSDRFTILYQANVADTQYGQDEFKTAMDDMDLDNIIEARRNKGMGVLTHKVDEDTSFQAYAYLSAAGFIQIWMEVVSTTNEPAILAMARFSWPPYSDDLVLHEQYAAKMQDVLSG